MSDELKGCPFCGGTDESLSHGMTRVDAEFCWYFVECRCGAMVERSTSEAEAIAAWNLRTPAAGRDAGLEEAAKLAAEWAHLSDAAYAKSDPEDRRDHDVGHLIAAAIRARKSKP